MPQFICCFITRYTRMQHLLVNALRLRIQQKILGNPPTPFIIDMYIGSPLDFSHIVL